MSTIGEFQQNAVTCYNVNIGLDYLLVVTACIISVCPYSATKGLECRTCRTCFFKRRMCEIIPDTMSFRWTCRTKLLEGIRLCRRPAAPTRSRLLEVKYLRYFRRSSSLPSGNRLAQTCDRWRSISQLMSANYLHVMLDNRQGRKDQNRINTAHTNAPSKAVVRLV